MINQLTGAKSEGIFGYEFWDKLSNFAEEYKADIRARASHFSVTSPNVLAAVRRRFSRCFSSAGDFPWTTALVASISFHGPRPAKCPTAHSGR